MIRALAFFCAACAFAQTPPEAGATISGVARDLTTGEPVAEASVTASNPPMRPVTATTDAQGRYTLRDIRAGTVQLSARGPLIAGAGFPPLARKFVTVGRGRTLDAIDVLIRTGAQISGTVIDQNDEPVPGISVMLVAREYQLGELRYVYARAARTDDQGKYVLANVTPGAAYLLLAMKSFGPVDAISDAPLDPRFRRPAVMPTYYPGVESVEGAQLFTLHSGEQRTGVDFRLHRGDSYCAQGTLSSGIVRFTYVEAKPHQGLSGDGGMYINGNTGLTREDGRVRICDLHPGAYELSVIPAPPGATAAAEPASIGFANFTVTDRDGGISVDMRPRTNVPGEVVWALDSPGTFAPPANWGLFVQPIRRSGSHAVRFQAAGPFTLENVYNEDYRVEMRQVPEGAYLKDIVYGSQSVLRAPFHPGNAVGEATLRVVLAHDGGTLNARVVDEEGKALADQFVIVVPADARSPAELADIAVSGQTDQNGAWTSPMLAPVKYYVFASPTPLDRTPETIDKLWTSRDGAKEVAVGSGKTVEASITLAF